MRTMLSFGLGSLMALAMIVSPILYQRWQSTQLRNFRVVEEGVLYRSGQLPLKSLQKVVAAHGIRTVISLRDGKDEVDMTEERWVNAKALNFVRIPHRPWVADETGAIPAEIGLARFREVMDDPANYPVLVHCYAGIHRTGTMCAVYRIDYQGWTNAEAMAEMRTLGYTILDAQTDVRSYFTHYRTPRRVNATPATTVSRQKKSVP